MAAEDAPQIEDWGSCHEVTEGADCAAVGDRTIETYVLGAVSCLFDLILLRDTASYPSLRGVENAVAIQKL